MAHFASGAGTKQLTELARFWNLVVFGGNTATINMPVTPPPTGIAYKWVIFITNEDGAAGVANVNLNTTPPGAYALSQIRASDAAFGGAGVPLPDAQGMRIDMELGEISAGGGLYYLDVAHTILPANIIAE
jgi:hypothetical protein